MVPIANTAHRARRYPDDSATVDLGTQRGAHGRTHGADPNDQLGATMASPVPTVPSATAAPVNPHHSRPIQDIIKFKCREPSMYTRHHGTDETTTIGALVGGAPRPLSDRATFRVYGISSGNDYKNRVNHKRFNRGVHPNRIRVL